MKFINTRESWIRTLLFIVASGLILYFFPHKSDRRLSYEVNRPWTHSLLTAPFDIPVQRDSISAQQMRDSITSAFVPVYQRDQTAKAAIIEAVSKSTELAPTVRLQLASLLSRVYETGVIDQNSWSKIKSGNMPTVRFIDNSIASSAPTDSFKSAREVYQLIDETFVDPATKRAIQDTKIAALINPNILPDSATSNRLLLEKLRMATAPIGVIQQGERIIDRGDIVTPELRSVLQTYEEITDSLQTQSKRQLYLQLAGQLVFIMILLTILYYYLWLFRHDLFASTRAMVCIMTLIVGFYIVASLVSGLFIGAIYIVPLAILPIVMCVFFDSRIATFAYLIEILMCMPLASFPTEFLIILFAGGVTAIFSIKEFSKRSQLIRTALLVFLVQAATYCAFELLVNGRYDTISTRLIGYFGINAVLISFAYLFMFILEKIFGFISEMTLVELSDINTPTLRELSEECPGTFQHSMSVSNLASDAAQRIGANVQLVRTGALYHDIGKLNNPAFFTENQHGVNPHVALDPIQSAKIVINHVNDGVKRAEKAKLPKVISDFILQHHGQGRAKYFYNTYCSANKDADIDPKPFTYPGPNPQTREASILMMADSVEAASRSLKEYTTGAITELVNRIIDSQIADGLHNESPISFRDITTIKEAFINRLRTMYHARVSYPDDPK